ncbi:MAG: hypothetical protein JKX97_07300, partial [Candidatus Lindowbacteria bacterium]|nr:hypothetical protein [Candidatus Lindowbacteria bacterium]
MPANHDLSNNSSNASEDLENRKKLEKIFMFFFAALFLCLPFVAQYQISFSGKEALVSDGLTFYVPLLKEQADTIRSGVLPLWSPSLFCGSPTLANPSIGFFEPSQLLYFFFSPVYASNLAPIAISGLILCLIFLMSYRVGLKGFAIFIPILVLLPKLLAYTSAPDYVWGLGLIPLLFLAIESYFQDVARRSSATCFIVMIGSSLILWGHPSCFFPGGIGIAIYCLLRIRVEDESLKKLGWFIGIGAAIIGVTAVLWIPFNEFRLSSGRGISNTNSFLPSLPYESWIAIFVPGFFGSDSARTTWRDIELPFATLIPILALLPISLLHLHRRFRVAAIILFILPVIIATGESAPWGPILRHIPGLLLLRHVSFWTYLMVIASMWIVASGMNQLQSVTHKPDNVATIWENLYRNLGIASIFISVLVGIWIAAGPISPDWVRWLADDLGTNTIPANIWDHRAASLNVAREATFFAGLTWTASFFTIACGLKSGSLPKLVIVMLVVLNLFQINNYKADVWEGSTEEIVHAAKKELAEFSPEGRIWTNGLSLTAYLIGRSSRPPYRLAEHAEQKEYIVPDEQEGRSRKIFKSLLKGLPANMVVLFDGRQFNGYSTLIPKRLIEFVTAGQRDAGINRMPQP